MTLKHLKQSSWTIEQANQQVKKEYVLAISGRNGEKNVRYSR